MQIYLLILHKSYFVLGDNLSSSFGNGLILFVAFQTHKGVGHLLGASQINLINNLSIAYLVASIFEDLSGAAFIVEIRASLGGRDFLTRAICILTDLPLDEELLDVELGAVVLAGLMVAEHPHHLLLLPQVPPLLLVSIRVIQHHYIVLPLLGRGSG